LRSTHGRWVDYVIEFARGIDNLVGYFDLLVRLDQSETPRLEDRLDYYFDHFLQTEEKVSQVEYLKEIDRYNQSLRESGPENGPDAFFIQVKKRYPEFGEKYRSWAEKPSDRYRLDFLEFLAEHSPFLNRKENKWMQTVLEVVRKTSLFFQPQIRTKIMNEGWATYWHDRLFLEDDRIQGHEIDYSKVNSQVAALSRVGLNPYALGLRLFQDMEEKADAGKYGYAFERLLDQRSRKEFSQAGSSGRDLLFAVRRHLADSLFIRQFVDQDFVDRHKLFVAGKRLDRARRRWQYYVKSRKASDYRKMLLNNLYHPPRIRFDVDERGILNLFHTFENRPLVEEFISNTMLGIEYLWGRPVTLETHRVKRREKPDENQEEAEILWEKVRYTMDQRKLSMESI
jgi:stage V sporulation protein R